MSFRHFFKRPTSISHKILAAIFLISSIVTLAITLIQLSFDYYQEMNALEKNMAIIKKVTFKAFPFLCGICNLPN